MRCSLAENARVLSRRMSCDRPPRERSLVRVRVRVRVALRLGFALNPNPNPNPSPNPSPSPSPGQVQAYCIGLLFDEIRALRREFYDTEVRARARAREP